jgi:hypothetical protein
MTAVQSELKLPSAAWPSVIGLVQSALNQSASDRLAGVTPLTAFTGLPADGFLKAVLRRVLNQVVKVHSLQDARAQQVLQLESAKKALEKRHVSVQERRTKKQKDAFHRHNARTGVRSVDFHVSDYVLQAKVPSHRGRKTMARWYGPKMVTKALSDFIFEVEDLITKRRDECHILGFCCIVKANCRTRTKSWNISHISKRHITWLTISLRFDRARTTSNF